VPARRAAPGLLSALVAPLLLIGVFVAPPHVAAGWPASMSLYHDYAEMVTEIHAVAAAHPTIAQVFSIGKSYKGRDIWVAKVSDNVTTDENEPEVLFDALHHAREHLTMEQALALFHTLVDDYATDPTVKAIVDSREIWIIFAVNPDGAEYDLTGDPYRAWRKNRQPTPHSSYIGTDLNRNYDYRWGCCGGSSSNPASITYRGWRAFSAPETRVIREFVASRVVNGRQQIRTHITFHTNGELILWPYGYTRTNVPGDMTVTDHNALVALGRGMAARNGYHAMQSSDLYITDGDQIDWMYGRYRIFSYTWELYPPETPSVWTDHYPPDETIAPQTARNRTALLYFLGMSDCPYRASGSQVANCGPIYDDFEIGRGWRVNPDGTDTSRSGAWQRANPSPTWSSGPKQLGTTASGSRDLVTGAATGRSATANDLDGRSSIASPTVALPPVAGPLTFRYSFAHSSGSSTSDWVRVYVDDLDATARTLVFQVRGSARDVDGAWTSASVALTPWAGKHVRILIVAQDGGSGNLLEAGIDDVRIRRSSG
jgi:carboxypeptidase T